MMCLSGRSYSCDVLSKVSVATAPCSAPRWCLTPMSGSYAAWGKEVTAIRLTGCHEGFAWVLVLGWAWIVAKSCSCPGIQASSWSGIAYSDSHSTLEFAWQKRFGRLVRWKQNRGAHLLGQRGEKTRTIKEPCKFFSRELHVKSGGVSEFQMTL